MGKVSYGCQIKTGAGGVEKAIPLSMYISN